jgi:hypothetical protein
MQPGDMQLGILHPDGRPVIIGRSSDGNFIAFAEYDRDDDGKLAITRLDINAWNPHDAKPILTETLRELPLGHWMTMAYSQLAESATALDSSEQLHGLTPEGMTRARRMASRVKTAQLRRGPKGFPPDFYRRIALTYLDLQSKGISRGIQQEIAKIESRRQNRIIDWVTVRDWLRRATELGFLTAGSKGRAGREPGPNLYTADTISKED